MNFIERLFGIAPDGGNGSVEVFWLFLILLTANAVRHNRRWLKRQVMR
jgi:hypothetical protein